MAIGPVKTPWHLWVVGVVSLLWNAFGGFDFAMSTTQGEVYWRSSGMTQPMIDYYNAMPGWMYVPWTLGVWGAVAGSILLLLRRQWAVPAFALSLLGAVVSLMYQKVIAPMPPLPEAMAAMGVMAYVIAVIAALLLWYAWAMGKRGVLR
ncbi:hypothetical protein BH10PSE1_BH10PSE1_02570 [soil metagenome]